MRKLAPADRARTHHHYNRTHAPLYVAEACYKYNVRGETDAFGKFLRLVCAA